MSHPENQLARYGAIAKAVPFTSNKVFFLLSSSEARLSEFLNVFPSDEYGVPRVYTTYATAITAIQAEADGGDGCVLYVSPNFTTAPTIAQIDALKAAGASVYQMGVKNEDGTYSAYKAATAITATTVNVFTITGRVELIDLEGEIVTTIGAVTTGAKFLLVPTVGSSTDLCVTTDVKNLAVGGTLAITGTFSDALIATTQGAVKRQAAPVILKAGTLQLNHTATTTGNVRYRMRYKPVEPGAFVSAAS